MKKTKNSQGGFAVIPLLILFTTVGGIGFYAGQDRAAKGHNYVADKSTDHHIVVGQGK